MLGWEAAGSSEVLGCGSRVRIGAGGGVGKEQLHREPPTPTVPQHQAHSPELPCSRTGTPRLAPHPPHCCCEIGMSRVGTEGLLGGLGMVSTWQSHGKRGFSAFPPCLKSEARQGGGGGGIFPAIIRSGFVKAQLSEA